MPYPPIIWGPNNTAKIIAKNGLTDINGNPIDSVSSGNTAAMAAAVGSSGAFYYNTSYNALFQWVVNSWKPVGVIDPRYGFYIFDDFASALTGSQLDWAAVGTVGFVSATSTTFGVLQLQQATAATRSAIYLYYPGANVFGSADIYYETLVSFPALATSTEDYVAQAGILDNPNYDVGGAFTDGACFRYARAANGAAWECVTAKGGTQTVTTTASAIVASTYYRLGIVITASASAKFYVNGVLVATNTTNIPNGVGNATGPLFKLDKTAGTAASNFNIDYFSLYGFFNGLRG